jgi:hypothetical protein
VPEQRSKQATVERRPSRPARQLNPFDGAPLVQPDAGHDVGIPIAVWVISLGQRIFGDLEANARRLTAGTAAVKESGPALAQILDVGRPYEERVKAEPVAHPLCPVNASRAPVRRRQSGNDAQLEGRPDKRKVG